jgi:RNA polymerase sigma factor (sigma-70 family)
MSVGDADPLFVRTESGAGGADPNWAAGGRANERGEAAVDMLPETRGLLVALRSGDSAAVAEFYRHFAPFIRAAVRRQLHHRLRAQYDSVDFVQDVWASFLVAPDRYRFDTPQALLKFLTRVAHHKVVEVFRQRFATQKADLTREVALPGDGLREEPPSASASPSQWAIAGEQWERMLRHVPPGHRVVVERLREGHDYKDIARLTNVSVSTVNRIVRRLKNLTGL